jgi:photosystem II stability/assembly factor-like uncharacterized protein
MNTLEDRVRAAIGATAEEIAPGSILPLTLPGFNAAPRSARPRPSGPGGRRAIAALAAAGAVLMLVAGAYAVSDSIHRPRPGTPAMARGASPANRSTTFHSAGRGPQTDQFQCVTKSVCYAAATVSGVSVTERTADGGAVWHPLAALPDHRALAADSGLTCPTTQMCAGVTGRLDLAVTTDGGAHWALESLAGLPDISGDSVDQVACATAENCVAHLHGATSGAFAYTSDGGRTWSLARPVPTGAPPGLWYLRCDPGGRCIGLAPTGTDTDGGLSALRSADGGRTWALSWSRSPATNIVLLSCGSALSCMFISDTGASMTTSDGGVTWRDHPAQRTWPDVATSVSCPAAGVCFVALAQSTGTSGPGYTRPVVEATRDGGRTWAALSLPRVNGSELAIVYPLSCPSAGGCLGVAATPQQFSGPGRSQIGRRVIISSFPR